jgi:hypothetical protein
LDRWALLRCALSPDAIEQDRCRLVVGVLVDELALERPLENGLAEACAAAAAGVHSVLESVDYRAVML